MGPAVKASLAALTSGSSSSESDKSGVFSLGLVVLFLSLKALSHLFVEVIGLSLLSTLGIPVSLRYLDGFLTFFGVFSSSREGSVILEPLKSSSIRERLENYSGGSVTKRSGVGLSI